MPSKILSIADALNNPLRRRILLLLTERPGMSLRQLARELEVGTGNLAGHLLILERVGLIKEERDPSHKQRVRLCVKEELQQMVRALERIHSTAQEDLVETIAAFSTRTRRWFLG